MPEGRGWARVSGVDAKTEELRAAHEVLADFYVERLAGALAEMPEERAVLDMFCERVVRAGPSVEVADVGCGTGRLLPYLASKGVQPRGVDLTPRMVEVARRDFPGFAFDVADVRALPFADAELAGVVCWYSLIYLAPEDRAAAYGQLARVVRPGGQLAIAYKAGDGELRRGGRASGLGVAFDVYWERPEEVEQLATAAGFEPFFRGATFAEGPDGAVQGYLLATRK